MRNNTTTYDVAVIGSGFSGSSLAAILARHGQRVVVFEAKSHPKFAIGESMILETSEVLRATAEFFDVPELAYFSSENFFKLAGTSHGVKRHFSYLHHTPGQPQNKRHSLQAVIPRQPHGHEMHLFRQDTDAFLTAMAVAYGAEVLQETPVAEVDVQADGVEIVTAKGEHYRANFVVDAGGFRSLLVQRFDLRDMDLQTHSRALFTHMVNVPCYNDVGGSVAEYGIPYRLSEGTLHHIFRGGWLWVIPFNNHPQATNPLCSVGLLLDPRVHPERPDLSPEEEFNAFVGQYPGMAAQFANAKSVRAWTRTGRIQYSSKQVVGDRFCLLGHAAGFIDPLFSKGLYVTSMSTALCAHLLLKAKETGDYSAGAFQPLEEQTLAYIRTNDRLIANSFRSFSHPKLWQVYSVLWLLGAYTELVMLNSARAQATDRDDYFRRTRPLHLAGGGFPGFQQIADRIDTLMEACNLDDQNSVDRTEAEIQAIFAEVDWLPLAFRHVLAGKNHLPANKLRLSLLAGNESFLKTGEYRKHFFGDSSMWDVTRIFVQEKVKYAVPVLEWQKRRRGGHND
ncbi:MAG: tryptophan 7-halogenase [Caldilineaceae bacterium]|nr:tryptophan 7-halogenase [Caldilineaceae bacterium]